MITKNTQLLVVVSLMFMSILLIKRKDDLCYLFDNELTSMRAYVLSVKDESESFIKIEFISKNQKIIMQKNIDDKKFKENGYDIFSKLKNGNNINILFCEECNFFIVKKVEKIPSRKNTLFQISLCLLLLIPSTYEIIKNKIKP
jgi:hypothetical protein